MNAAAAAAIASPKSTSVTMKCCTGGSPGFLAVTVYDATAAFVAMSLDTHTCDPNVDIIVVIPGGRST